LDNDSSLSTSYVATWIRNNVGKVNNLVGTSFDLDENLEYTPCINQSIKDIIKHLYVCHYWSMQAKANFGASAFDITELREGDNTIRLSNKTDNAKIFSSMAKDCNVELMNIIKFYKANSVLPASLSSFNSPMYLYSRTED
jgi:hypothetical protein